MLLIIDGSREIWNLCILRRVWNFKVAFFEYNFHSIIIVQFRSFSFHDFNRNLKDHLRSKDALSINSFSSLTRWDEREDTMGSDTKSSNSDEKRGKGGGGKRVIHRVHTYKFYYTREQWIEGINLRDCCSADLINCFTIDTLLMCAICMYIYIFNVIFADFIYRASESERWRVTPARWIMNSENKPAVREIYRSINVKSLRVNAKTVPLTAWTRVSTYTRINSFHFRASASRSILFDPVFELFLMLLFDFSFSTAWLARESFEGSWEIQF